MLNKQLYGISHDTYKALVEKQNGLCAICNFPPRDKYGSSDGLQLSVDQNKKTGVIRGLLCRSCKTAITFSKEDPKVAQAIADYLTLHTNPVKY